MRAMDLVTIDIEAGLSYLQAKTNHDAIDHEWKNRNARGALLKQNYTEGKNLFSNTYICPPELTGFTSSRGGALGCETSGSAVEGQMCGCSGASQRRGASAAR